MGKAHEDKLAKREMLKRKLELWEAADVLERRAAAIMKAAGHNAIEGKVPGALAKQRRAFGLLKVAAELLGKPVPEMPEIVHPAKMREGSRWRWSRRYE